jgi:hypothetical protein
MTKGRPGVSYEQFFPLWEQLLNEGKARNNTACELLGASKGTIAKYRERYEQEHLSKERGIITGIQLTDEIIHAISLIKVKEITLLEETQQKQQERMDHTIQSLNESEIKNAELLNRLEELQQSFDIEKRLFEQKLAVSEAKTADLLQREQKANERYDSLNEKYHLAMQETAVAKKEIELLRETCIPAKSQGK